MSALERLPLKTRTPIAWVAAVEADFDNFLVDHASCERKAFSTAMSLISRFHDKKSHHRTHDLLGQRRAAALSRRSIVLSPNATLPMVTSTKISTLKAYFVTFVLRRMSTFLIK